MYRIKRKKFGELSAIDDKIQFETLFMQCSDEKDNSAFSFDLVAMSCIFSYCTYDIEKQYTISKYV